jgi:ABC-2 type transport system permease protein
MTIRVWTKAAAYAGVIVCVLALGYATSRPALRVYADGTDDNRNTISPVSQQILDELDGRVTITSWVNIMHTNADMMFPTVLNHDKGRYEQYMRFHPNMRLEYVYYYARTDRPSPAAWQNDISGKLPFDSLALNICKVQGIDPADLLTQAQAQELCPISLSYESNPVVTILTAEGHEPRPLRFFNDNMVLPSENEIAAAFKGLATKLPLVVYLNGRGTIDLTSRAKENYNYMMNSHSTRSSLINQGFRVEQVLLSDDAIPEGADVVVLANPTEELTPTELEMIAAYIAGGGNMLLMADAGNEQNMNRIAASLGISFSAGYLVQPHPGSEDLYPHISLNSPTPDATLIDPSLARWTSLGIKQPMRMATAIELPSGSGWTPILTSSPDGWLKRERVNLLDGTLEPDSTLGESRGSHVTMAAMERETDGKKQRIIVTSDAEWFSNVEMGTSYADVSAAPASLGLSCFGWLADAGVPVEVVHGTVHDGRIDFRDSGLGWFYYLYIWVLPVLMGAIGVLLFRRRNRQ